MKTVKRGILLATVAFISVISCVCAQKADEVAEADSAYTRGEYAEAITGYKNIGETQGWSSALYYDLGNAYARGGDYGNAMVNYLRALRLDPANARAKANIQYIDTKVYDSNRAELKGKKMSIERDTPSFFSNVKSFIVRDHLSDTWAIWGAVSFIAFIICVALYIFTRNVPLRKFGFFGGFILLGISVVTVVFAFAAADYKSNEGVVTAAKARLKSEASLSAKESPVALNRGTRMEILDSVSSGGGNAEWYKVRLNSDFVGWLQAGDFCAVGK